MSAGSWPVEFAEGTAQELQDLDTGARRSIRVNRVVRPAIVLGSRQDSSRLSREGLTGIDLATRRTGGAAMWLEPGAQVWIDLVVTRGEQFHREDVGEASRLAGRLWSAVLGAPTRVWSGGMSAPRAQELACFAGVGPGEVVVGRRKLVGISQRRTARCSRIQCVAYLRWEPAGLLRALGLGADGPRDELGAQVRRSLVDGVAVIGDPRTESQLGAGVPDPRDADARVARSFRELLDR